MISTNIGRTLVEISKSGLLAVLVIFTYSADAANYPLELVSPRAAGSHPSSDSGTPAMPGGHRIFRAYPGIPYSIRAVVIAGEYPYSFRLSNAPNDMTINARSGEITWLNPARDATPTITVRDAEGTERSASWRIVVTTDGFRFVDSVSGSDSNPGTLTAPWATLARVKSGGGAGDIVYFRTGTYSTAGMATSDGEKVEFNGSSSPVQMIAYPGETPVYSGGRSRIWAFTGSSTHPVYVEGISMTELAYKGIQVSGTVHYNTFRNLAFDGPYVGADGSNPAGIMTSNTRGSPSYYTAFQNLSQRNGVVGLIKIYSQKKMLWEELDIQGGQSGPDLKSEVPRFEVRGCTFRNMMNADTGGIHGNMQAGAGGSAEAATGEIRFNLVDRRNAGPDAHTIELNLNADSGRIDVYRNTLLGGLDVKLDDDGPFSFSRNIVINTESGYRDRILVRNDNGGQITYSNNLVGGPSSNIVDASGRLTAEYSNYLGAVGHQIGPETRPPSPPTGLRVE